MRDLALKIMKIYGREMSLKQVDFNNSDRKKERDIYVRIPDVTKAKKF
jgi:hypothetical protein